MTSDILDHRRFSQMRIVSALRTQFADGPTYKLTGR
jgi:hypothetical protein